MGLFNSPNDITDSYMSVGYGVGKTPFSQNTYDSFQGYDRYDKPYVKKPTEGYPPQM
jgi:hypothetical protein